MDNSATSKETSFLGLPTVLQSLTASFLAAGDLSTSAAVSKAGCDVALTSLKKRSKSNNANQLRDMDVGNKKQKMLVYETLDSIPPCYRNKNPGRDFLKKQTNFFMASERRPTPKATLEEKDGIWYVKLPSGRRWTFPSSIIQENHARIHACYSIEDRTLLLIVSVKQDSIGPASYSRDRHLKGNRSLFAIFYNNQNCFDRIEEPVAIQRLVSDQPIVSADFEEAKFADSVLSGDGKTLIVTTDVRYSHWRNGACNDVRNCTLTHYRVTGTRLEKIQDIPTEVWDFQRVLSACLGTCGQLLSLWRLKPSRNGTAWTLYDLRSNPARVIFEKLVSPRETIIAEKAFFTPDNDIVIELWNDNVRREHKPEEEGSAMAQYVETYFGFLKDTPSFCNRVVIQYHG